MIRIATELDTMKIIQLFQEVTLHLQSQGNFQWNLDYPSSSVIHDDIRNKSLFVYEVEQEIIASISIDVNQPENYSQIPWTFLGNPVCIHRLAVLPAKQGNNIGYKMCLFAETYATKNGFNIIRLDSFAENKAAHHLYQNKLNYHLLKNHSINVNGTAFCQCFEKKI